MNPFLEAYLVSFVYLVALAVGAQALLWVHVLVGGRWGEMAGPWLRAATKALPLLLLLFLPLAIFAKDLFPWVDPSARAAAEAQILKGRAPYLNLGFFVLRALIYFAIWIGWPSLVKRCARDDSSARTWSGVGLVLLALAATFASIDWIQSLEVDFSSTIFGLIYLTGGALGALSWVLVGVGSRKGLLPDRAVVQDLGTLLFASLILYTYLAFMQFLVVWMGNLPEEMSWYLHRNEGFWAVVPPTLIAGGFALPFLVLLPRNTRRSPRLLRAIASLLLFLFLVNLSWQVLPAFRNHGPPAFSVLALLLVFPAMASLCFYRVRRFLGVQNL